MPSRAELVLRACAVNVDHTLAKYQNDSVLEQKVLNAEKALTATSTATTLAAPSSSTFKLSGDKNV
jgi:hypothetical protein